MMNGQGTLFGGNQEEVNIPETDLMDRSSLVRFLESLCEKGDLDSLKKELTKLIRLFKSAVSGLNGNVCLDDKECKFVLNELLQVYDAKTLERTKYYIRRLIKSLTEVKTGKINDINLNRWKEYDEIITDSLWIFDKRDTSGSHLAWYWGNFVPQIPRQLMLRYTKMGDWVLDPFVGSGTTLIECRRLGRNGIGIDINPDVVNRAKQLIEKEHNKFGVFTDVIVGDSTSVNFREVLNQRGVDKVQLVILHPPYFDIIKFTDNPSDLSNASSIDNFLIKFGKVLDNIIPVLEKNRYLSVVIGDKYSKGEWIPLGFYVMNEVMKRKVFTLKSIVVKNFEETRAKRNQKELWRYRALVGGFYVFKHEYIFLFCKNKG